MSGLACVESPYVGLVRSVDERLTDTADARLPVYTTELADDERLLGGPLAHVGAACGMDPGPRRARDAALGEAVERYSLSFLPRERLRYATADELGEEAVAPECFELFAREQYARPRFPFVPFTSATRVAWIDGWSCTTGERAWLPAELVLLADAAEAGAARIGYATSSGAACAATRDEAVLRGLFELCERDAVMILWAARLSLPLLDWSRSGPLCELDARYFAPSGVGYAVVDLSRFHGVPSALGVVRASERAGAVLGVGAGTAATIEAAWLKALAEAFGTRTAASHRLRAGARDSLRAEGDRVLSVDDHIVFHAVPEQEAATAFLDASTDRRPVADVPPLPPELDRQLHAVVAAIAATGSGVYAVDVTAPDVRELGLHVVKTIAPGLVPLDVPHPARFLGARRLRSVPAAFGARPGGLNPDPHPFP